MNVKIKLAAYAVLALLVIFTGWGFYSSYTAVTKETAEPAPVADVSAAPTNAASTNDASSTNDTAATNEPAKPAPPPTAATPPPPAHGRQGRMIGYLGAFVGSIIGLGLLMAHDFTQYVGGAAVDALLDDKGEGMRDPEYEKAEQAWADGKFLEAIQMMRDFLKTHPRAQYAALRIAEIYEKDLHNLVAAVLEYEEVLKQKLKPERWGWAAIHLCNLYSKLGQQDKTRELLQRVVDEYPKTAAAKKARARLGLPEPEPEPAPAVAKEEMAATEETGEDITGVEAEEEELPEPEPEPPPPPKSNLPPGFRPKG